MPNPEDDPMAQLGSPSAEASQQRAEPDQRPAAEDLDLVKQVLAQNYTGTLSQHWQEILAPGEEDSESTDSAPFLFRPKEEIGLDPQLDANQFARKPGDRIGDFELRRLIGQGGMGQVWEAWQVGLERRVALKLIRPDRVNPDALRYFHREGRTAGRLNHPGVVALHSQGTTEGIHWIAQEYIPGGCTLTNFLEHIRDAEVLPGDFDQRIARFFLELAEALQSAHSQSVVHLDVKPGNVLVAEGDHPKLTDFGLARNTEESVVSAAGGLRGTPAYMSPEQALGGVPDVGAASDQFSFGCMLYEALTRVHPFQRGDLANVLEAVALRVPLRPRAVRQELHPDLEAIVQRTMEKAPAHRYPSMKAVAEDLKLFLAGRPPLTRRIRALGRAKRWVQRNRVLSLAALAVLIAVACFSFLFGALRNAREQTRELSWASKVQSAELELVHGRVSEAEVHLQAAEDLLPGKPEIPLLRAGVLARHARFREAEDELVEAEGRGYNPLAVDPEDAHELYLRGLYSMARGRTGQYQAAQVDLTRALDLDPTLHVAWYPLYQTLYATAGRDPQRLESSAQALERHLSGLTLGDPGFAVSKALLLEVRGDLHQARQRLLELEEGSNVTTVDLLRISFHHHLGRILLKLGEYQTAIVALDQALVLEPRDSEACLNRALAHLRSYEQESDQEQRALFLARCKRDAELAWTLCSDKRSPLQVLAQVESYAGGPDPSQSRMPSARQRLQEFDPSDTVLLAMDAGPHFDAGRQAWEAGDYELALAEFETGFAATANARTNSATRYLPCLLSAQEYQYRGGDKNLRRARDLINEAFELWLDRDSTRANAGLAREGDLYNPQLTQALLVYRYLLAAQLKDTERATESKAHLEEELLSSDFIDPAEQLTYAEALAVHDIPVPLRKERASELLKRYFSVNGIQGDAWPADYDAAIRNIQQALHEN